MVYNPKLTYKMKLLLDKHPELASILDPFLREIDAAFDRIEKDKDRLTKEVEALTRHTSASGQGQSVPGAANAGVSATGSYPAQIVSDISSQVTVLLDFNGFIINPSRSFESFFGFDRPSTGSNIIHLCLEESWERFTKSIVPAVEAGGVWEGRLKMRRLNGAPVLMLLRAEAMPDEAGVFQYVIATFHNTSYQQTNLSGADESLPDDPYNTVRYIAASAEKRALMQCVLDPAWLKSADGRYTAVNRAFCRLTQKQEHDILGRTSSELFQGAAARFLMDMDNEALRAGRLLRKESALQLASQNVRWYEAITAPAAGPDGEIVALAGMLREIVNQPGDEQSGGKYSQPATTAAQPGAWQKAPLSSLPPDMMNSGEEQPPSVPSEPGYVKRTGEEAPRSGIESMLGSQPGSKIDLQLRDAIMAAITLAAEYFLRVPPWEKHIGEVLEWLGRATNVSRVYLYQNGKSEDGLVYTALRNSWASSGILPINENVELAYFVYEDCGLLRWVETMRTGDPIMGDVAEFPDEELRFLRQLKCKSIVLFPIIVDGVWWGFLGFDDCVIEREWKPILIDALKTATNLIGAVIERERTEGTYRTMVEQSLQELFIAQHGRIVYANPEAIRNSGFTEQELYRFGSTDLYANVIEEDKSKIANALHSLKSDTFDNIRIEFRFKSRDGSIRWIESLLSRVQYKGAPAIQIVQVDITERKQAEESLHHRSSMESLIGNLTAKFINLSYETIDIAIAESLEMLARFFDADRCHLLILDMARQTGHVTHEWHQPGMQPLLPRLANVNFSQMPFLRKSYTREDPWLCHSLNEVSDEAVTEKRALVDLHIASFAMVPVIVNGKTVGNITLSYSLEQKSLPREIIPAVTLAGEVIITTLQRKRVEESLVRTREMYKLATEAGKVGVWDWDVARNEFFIDDTLRDMVGFSDDDVPMSVEKFMQHLLPNDYPSASNLIQDIFNNEEYTRRSDTYESEHKILHSNGETLWFLVRALVIRDADGQARRIVGTNTNVTALKKAEAALRQSQAWNLAILNSLPDYAFVMDGSGTFTDEMVGESQRRQFPQQDIVGKSIMDFMPHESRSAVEQKLRTVLETGEVELIEYEISDPETGERQFYEVRLSRISADSILAMNRDITNRKQSERVLLKTNTTLKTRNEELDAFSHTVAHDLKNPLTLVIGYAGLLNEAAADMKPSELKQYLSNILLNSKRMNSIIESLLLLAEVRQEDVKFESMDMKYIVDEAISRLGYMIQDYNAVIVMPDQWPQSVGYSSWIEEVWVNYITNAMKYGGRPPRVELGADDSMEGYIRYWVRDNGRGIAKDDITKLFSPLTRLSTSSVKGYGLGLSIVKRIVEKLNGIIGVESEPGSGSKFWFALPLTQLDVET